MFSWLWNTITRRAESPPTNSQSNSDLSNDSPSTKNNRQTGPQHSVVNGGNISKATSDGEKDSHLVSNTTKTSGDKRGY